MLKVNWKLKLQSLLLKNRIQFVLNIKKCNTVPILLNIGTVYFKNVKIFYPAVYPPSTGIAIPVINEAASEHNHTTASATSSGLPILPIGSIAAY